MQKTFTIPQGQHGARLKIGTIIQSLTFNEKLCFEFRFDESAEYKNRIPYNKADINKVFGFKEGLFGEDNSARLGWNWYDDHIRLYPYVHTGGRNYGKESPKPICSVLPGELVRCVIHAKEDKYWFYVKGMDASCPRVSRAKIRRLSYPYFGGDEVAPHDITIALSLLHDL